MASRKAGSLSSKFPGLRSTLLLLTRFLDSKYAPAMPQNRRTSEASHNLKWEHVQSSASASLDPQAPCFQPTNPQYPTQGDAGFSAQSTEGSATQSQQQTIVQLQVEDLQSQGHSEFLDSY